MIEAVACAAQTVLVNTGERDFSLTQRSALFALLAMTLAIAMGLLAWGPILLQAGTHHYAEMRSLFGAPNGVNAAFCLPLLAAGVWGWRAVGRSNWPASLQTPWRWCFSCIAVSAVLATAYHLAPGDRGYLAVQASAAGASTLLLCGFLGERVDVRFGSQRACVVALGLTALATVMSSLGTTIDLRPLLLLQLLPVLLIPAGAPSLPGSHTRQGDWLLILGLYALARAGELGDGAAMRFTGGTLSGHALMHLCLASVAGWLAYLASTATVPPAATESGGLARANTSLSTSG